MLKMRMILLPVMMASILSSCSGIERIGALCGRHQGMPPQQPQYTVNTIDDPSDPNAVCWEGGSCSLRAAITSANVCRSFGSATIILQPRETYTPSSEATAPGNMRQEWAEERAVGSPVTLPYILGNLTLEGHGATIVRSNNQLSLFQVARGGTLHLNDLTLQGDTRRDSIVDGGAVHNRGTFNADRVTFKRMRGSRGGALYNASGPNVTAIVSNSVFLENFAEVTGSAVYNLSDSLMPAVVRSTKFTENSGRHGTARNIGGAVVHVSGTMKMIDVHMTDNFVNPIVNTGTLEIINSAFTNNGMRNRTEAIIHQIGGRLELQASTISSNQTYFPFSCVQGTVALSDVTIVQNYLTPSSFPGPSALTIRRNCTVTVSNSVLGKSVGPVCVVEEPGSLREVHTSIANDDSCHFSRVSDSFGLLPLGVNGGSTPTHLPGPGSPLIDAGGANCLSPDQRGEMRPRGLACDIGAAEAQ